MYHSTMVGLIIEVFCLDDMHPLDRWLQSEFKKSGKGAATASSGRLFHSEIVQGKKVIRNRMRPRACV